MQVNEAIEAARHGKHDVAEKAARTAVERDPTFAQSYLSLGQILILHRQRPDRAIPFLQQGLQREGLEPALEAKLAYWLGVAHNRVADGQAPAEEATSRQSAVEAFDRALARDPKLYVAHHERGLALRALGKFGLADDAFRECHAIEPRYHDCPIALAYLYRDTRRPELGLEVMKAVAASEPSDPHVYLALARIESRLGWPTLARQSLDRAQKLAPDDLDVAFELGAALGGMRETLSAMSELEACLAGSEGRSDLEARRVEAQRMLDVLATVI